MTKEQYIELLKATGQSERARLLQQWKDKNGRNWGWDGFVKTWTRGVKKPGREN